MIENWYQTMDHISDIKLIKDSGLYQFNKTMEYIYKAGFTYQKVD